MGTLPVNMQILLLVSAFLLPFTAAACARDAGSPFCNPVDVYFRTEQCSTDTTPQCWCVNPASGLEIVNTRTSKSIANRVCHPEAAISVYLQIRSNCTFQQVYKRVNASETQRLFQRFTDAFSQYLQAANADYFEGVAFGYNLLAMTGYGSKVDLKNQSSQKAKSDRYWLKQTEMKLQVSVLGFGESLITVDSLTQFYNNLLSKGVSLQLNDAFLVRRVRVLENNETNRTASPSSFQELSDQARTFSSLAPFRALSSAKASQLDTTNNSTSFPTSNCKNENNLPTVYANANCDKQTSQTDLDEYSSEETESRRSDETDEAETEKSSVTAQVVDMQEWFKVVEHPAFMATAICLMLVVALLAVLGSLYCARQTHCLYRSNAHAVVSAECVRTNRVWCPVKSTADYYGAPGKVDQEFFA